MPDDIFVSPAAATSTIIRVSGICYKRVDGSPVMPNVTSVDPADKFDHCDPCNAAPCTCPDDVLSTYTLNIPAGSAVDGATTYAWDAQSFIMNVTETPCLWEAEISPPFYYGEDGGPKVHMDQFIMEICPWDLVTDQGINFRKTVGQTPVGVYTYNGVGTSTATARVV